jgi:hypothetical protein
MQLNVSAACSIVGKEIGKWTKRKKNVSGRQERQKATDRLSSGNPEKI